MFHFYVNSFKIAARGEVSVCEGSLHEESM